MKVPDTRYSLHRPTVTHKSKHLSLCITWFRAKAVIKTALLEPGLIDGIWHTGGWGRKGIHSGAGDSESWHHMPVTVASLRDTTSGFKSKALLCSVDGSRVGGNDSKWPQLLSNLVLWPDHRRYLVSNFLCCSLPRGPSSRQNTVSCCKGGGNSMSSVFS